MALMDGAIAARLGGKHFGRKTEIYKFERIKAAKAEARLAHPELPLIDMGVGEPDEPASAPVVETLAAEAGKAENRFYADNGIPEFKAAAAAYLDAVYGVRGLDPEKQILHGVGSKPILALLPVCLVNPGDVLLTTTPGYPVASTWTRYLGGEVYEIPLLPENGYLPAVNRIPRPMLKKAKVLYINYPNNPTGASATHGFFADLVDWAAKHNVVVIHDAAYGALTYDGEKPLSFLSIKGASDVGVEVHSLSKAFDMTGWRLGFVAGNEKLVKAYGTVKDNTDSGQFRAIQKAGIRALSDPALTRLTADKYSRRFNLLVAALKELGFDARKPKASFYCYVRAPKKARGEWVHSAADFADFLIREALVSVVPWDETGPYLRFSVTFEAKGEKEEKRVIDEMAKRLKDLNLEF